jgi:hypothetical protein
VKAVCACKGWKKVILESLYSSLGYRLPVNSRRTGKRSAARIDASGVRDSRPMLGCKIDGGQMAIRVEHFYNQFVDYVWKEA